MFFLISAGACGEIKATLHKINPHVLVMYHWEGISAVHGIRSFPKLGVVGDSVHLPYLYRQDFQMRCRNRDYLVDVIRRKYMNRLVKYQKKYMRELLLDCDKCGAFAHHHAQMFRDWEIPCEYYRTPVPDPFLNGKRQRSLPLKPKLLLLGHLKGIATLSGIDFFAREIFPLLLKRLCEDGFEIHIVGGFFETLPQQLRKLLTHPAVMVRGHISPVDGEFLTSHALFPYTN